MCSFDIKSLFTNIPLDETIEIILNKLFPNINNKYKNFTRTEFKSLLQLTTKNSIFMFDQQLYEQIDGVAMGSPCGPTFANLFLCHYENIWLNECPSNFKPIHYKRYVDDTFLLFRDQHHINQFSDYINSKHYNIKFTHEIEENNKLSFLDITVIRENNKFETAIFRKNIFTHLGLNFLSYEPMKYKINAIKTLIYRAFNLTSNYIYFNNEVIFLNKYFEKNAFPSNLFFNYLKKFLNNSYYNHTLETTVENN